MLDDGPEPDLRRCLRTGILLCLLTAFVTTDVIILIKVRLENCEDLEAALEGGRPTDQGIEGYVPGLLMVPLIGTRSPLS